MICNNCGAEIDNGFKFCKKCGSPITAEKKKKGSAGRILGIILLVIAVIAIAAGGVFALYYAKNNLVAARSIVVEKSAGTVEVTGTRNKGDAYKGEHLVNGDAVDIKEASSLTMCIDMDKHVYAEENTRFHIGFESDRRGCKSEICVDEGNVRSVIDNKLGPYDSYEVDTPNSTMSVRGTSFTVTVIKGEAGEDYTLVDVEEGCVNVKLKGPDGEYTGEETDVNKGEKRFIARDKDGVVFADIPEGTDADGGSGSSNGGGDQTIDNREKLNRLIEEYKSEGDQTVSTDMDPSLDEEFAESLEAGEMSRTDDETEDEGERMPGMSASLKKDLEIYGEVLEEMMREQDYPNTGYYLSIARYMDSLSYYDIMIDPGGREWFGTDESTKVLFKFYDMDSDGKDELITTVGGNDDYIHIPVMYFYDDGLLDGGHIAPKDVENTDISIYCTRTKAVITGWDFGYDYFTSDNGHWESISYEDDNDLHNDEGNIWFNDLFVNWYVLSPDTIQGPDSVVTFTRPGSFPDAIDK